MRSSEINSPKIFYVLASGVIQREGGPGFWALYGFGTIAKINKKTSGLSWELSGPLRLRVQSRSRMRLRIAASIVFLFRACFEGVLDTIVLLSRG